MPQAAPSSAEQDRRRAFLAAVEAARRGEGGIDQGLDLRGLRLVDADLRGIDLSGRDLSGADLSRARLDGCRMVRAKLGGAILFEARLDGAELLGADLSGAEMSGCSARRAGFGKAKLSGAVLSEAALQEASLVSADLRDSDLKLARFEDARLRSACLSGADLSRADLRRADLEDCVADGASFREADLRGARLKGMHRYAEADWVGADLREVDFNGAHLLRRHVLDQNYLDEFRSHSRANELVYRLWSITSDCGRSLLRWGLWTALIAVVFAALYTAVGVDYGRYRTWLSPLYFSVVTLTTLGYGDAVPSTVSGQLAVMAEVVLGYGMLGGLLSIFSTRMGRRAD